MNHLLVCREYPPAPGPAGGIGTYTRILGRLLVAAGETVHVIAQRWAGAPQVRSESIDGRLIVHRVALDDPTRNGEGDPGSPPTTSVAADLLNSSYPVQAFSWQASLLAELLVETEGIDVVEAPEWEAPLYYFQLRRSLGLGPARQPPCVVHLHSPSEMIFAANGWDTTVVDYRPATDMEARTIAAADMLLCPSRFVAALATERYELDPSAVHVIPYPVDDSGPIERSAATWTARRVCFIGRLEPRKGALELADAFAEVAAEFPDLVVECVGEDTPLDCTGGPSVGASMHRRIPRGTRRRLRFLGPMDRKGMRRVLGRASAGIVPSRWDNLPYSCIESMCSGLPMIASPNGGMRELIDDGESGWIAVDATSSGLTGALRRALTATAPERARMGAAASASIRRRCENDVIVRRHIELKVRVVEPCGTTGAGGPGRASRPSPPALDGTTRPRAGPSIADDIGVGVVVRETRDRGLLDACLNDLAAQTEPPAWVRVVGAETSALADAKDDLARRNVEPNPDGESFEVARRASLALPATTAVVFIDARGLFVPDLLATCRAAFDKDDRVGVVASWARESAPGGKLLVPTAISAPHVFRDERLAPWVAVRTAAFEDVLLCATDRESRMTLRTLFDEVLGAGWTGLTYPRALYSVAARSLDDEQPREALYYSAMARGLQRLHTPIMQWLLTCSPTERRTLLLPALSAPLRSLARLASRGSLRWRRRR